MWRLLLHPQMKVTRTELETSWCIDDVCDAHNILDALDDHMIRAQKGIGK